MLHRFIEQTIISAFYSTTKSDEDKSKKVIILSLGDIAPFMYKKFSEDRKKGRHQVIIRFQSDNQNYKNQFGNKNYKSIWCIKSSLGSGPSRF